MAKTSEPLYSRLNKRIVQMQVWRLLRNQKYCTNQRYEKIGLNLNLSLTNVWKSYQSSNFPFCINSNTVEKRTFHVRSIINLIQCFDIENNVEMIYWISKTFYALIIVFPRNFPVNFIYIYVYIYSTLPCRVEGIGKTELWNEISILSLLWIIFY